MSPEIFAHMCEIAERCASRDPYVDHDYWAAEAARALPIAMVRIDEQAKQIEILKKIAIDEISELITYPCAEYPGEQWFYDEAKKRLAAEYPEVEWP